MKSLFGLALTVLLSGCVGAPSVYKAELDAGAAKTEPTFQANMRSAETLAANYIQLSDQAAVAQDAAALGIIAAAGVAAGTLLFDGGSGFIKGAGLAAGGLTATSGYFKPGETSLALLSAAEQLQCVHSAGQLLVRDTRLREPGPNAVEIISSSILTVRLNLRKKLSRQLPDYASLVAALQATYAPSGTVVTASGVSTDVAVEAFRTAALKCLLK